MPKASLTLAILWLPHYSPILVLLIGVATFAGCMGFGLLVQRILRLRFPTPFRTVVAACLGMEILSLTVQVAAMAGYAYPSVLVSLWGVIVAVGALGLWLSRNELFAWPKKAYFLIPTVPLLILLLIALAPSTKNDEIYYHMTVPARIVADHALRFYREPWEGAIFPQMGFQIATAPLHALGFPDASNVLSVCFAGLLAGFVAQYIFQRIGDARSAAIYSTVAIVGTNAMTLYCAAGPHALGDLACTALVLIGINIKTLRKEINATSLLSMTSILAVAGAMTKVPFLLMCVLVSAYCSLSHVLMGEGWGGGILFWRRQPPPQPSPGVPGEGVGKSAINTAAIFASVLPWLIFYSPLLIWTWKNSGSPLGPLLAGKMGTSVYDVPLIRQFLADARRSNLFKPMELILTPALYYSLAMWVGAGLFFVRHEHEIDRLAKRFGAILLIGQALFVALYLPQSARFLASIPLALFIAAMGTHFKTWKVRNTLTFLFSCLTLLCSIGLTAGSVMYARVFVPSLCSTAARERFLAGKIPLLADYRALDKLLPADAIILAPDENRTDCYYSPRLIVLDPADVPADRPVYMLRITAEKIGPPRYDLSGWKIGQLIYSNPTASVQCYRDPRKPPLTGKLELFRITK